MGLRRPRILHFLNSNRVCDHQVVGLVGEGHLDGRSAELEDTVILERFSVFCVVGSGRVRLVHDDR